MTGRPMEVGDGIYDDGEWMSWDYINQHLHDRDLQEEFPKADLQLIHVFETLVEAAADYKALTGRYLQVWGELGELYAELKFGIKRHKAHAPGSDGRMGNDFVEVKTISPEKTGDKVEVKWAGNFNRLCVVRIGGDLSFEARMIDRKKLTKGEGGKVARVRWSAMEEPNG
ncbi:hypothetical protein [Lysobacter sp. HA35]